MQAVIIDRRICLLMELLFSLPALLPGAAVAAVAVVYPAQHRILRRLRVEGVGVIDHEHHHRAVALCIE